MKRYLVPALAGVVVFGSVTAFAATLTVTSDTLGAGDALVASCNDDATISHSTVYRAGRHELASLTVTTGPAPVAPATAPCALKQYKFMLEAAGVPLAFSGSLTADGDVTVFVAGSRIPAESFVGLSVVVSD